MTNYTFSIPVNFWKNTGLVLEKNLKLIVGIILVIISITAFVYYWRNGLGIAYNDARSHLDIGRRVIEGLKPGLAQLGSVWLPLLHFLMIPTIWNNFMWHSGLSGALVSMISFVFCGLLIYQFLEQLGVGKVGRLTGVIIFAANLNILYLQSTAMTELLLLATMTAGSYELLIWHKTGNYLNLVKSAIWIMLSTLTRYDGWFLLFYATLLIIINVVKKKSYKTAEGTLILFLTMAALGVVLWFLWNLLIFKDPFYFITGPFSAKAQQDLLSNAGVLPTKGNFFLSMKVYLYALMYNTQTFPSILGLIGAIILWFDNKINRSIKMASTVLLAPLFFNIIALYIGHSVLYVQGISGNTWFNVRYGIMLLPSIAIFIGYLIDKLKPFRVVLISLILFTSFFSIVSGDAVTIDDAKFGSSQKNVTEISEWLKENVTNENSYILISVASHDAIVFSSGLPMKRFIHEGTGDYWNKAIINPDKYAKYIIMRTNDATDMTFRLVGKSPGFSRYQKISSFPFADIYELRPEYWNNLATNTK